MRLRLLLFAFLTLTSFRNASALIIHIDAVTNTAENRVSVFFAAGTYTVTPIGISDGGVFNAWDANIFDGLTGVSWIHKYSIASAEFGPVEFGDGNYYENDLDALAHAVPTAFTLTGDGFVDFYIADNPHTDNAGGVSLDIVPEPSTALLLAMGLSGLAVLARRRGPVPRCGHELKAIGFRCGSIQEDSHFP